LGIEDKGIATEGASTDPGSSRRPPKQRTWAQKWRAVSINNKLIVIFSGITMLATVVYSVVAGWTLIEIHTESTDTHALAVAAQAQGVTMQSQLTEMQKQTAVNRQQLVGSQAAVLDPVIAFNDGSGELTVFTNEGRVTATDVHLKG
jgi:hypothetical protein